MQMHETEMEKCEKSSAELLRSFRPNKSNEYSIEKQKFHENSMMSYPCFICKSSFGSTDVLKKHMSEAHDSIYKQSFLKRSFPVGASDDRYTIKITKYDEDSVENQKVHDNSMKLHQCFICKSRKKKSRFGSTDDLKKHMSEFHDSIYKQNFLKRSLVVEDSNYGHATEIDNFSMIDPNQYSVEKQRVQENMIKLHSCFICKSSFGTSNDLKKHMSEIHDSSYKQNFLKKSFPVENAKDKSTVKIAKLSETDPIKCSLCSKEFFARDDLTSHMVDIHGYRRTYQCPICNAKFTNKENIQNHMVENHKKPEQHKPSIRLPQSQPIALTNLSNRQPYPTSPLGENHNFGSQVQKGQILQSDLMNKNPCSKSNPLKNKEIADNIDNIISQNHAKLLENYGKVDGSDKNRGS